MAPNTRLRNMAKLRGILAASVLLVLVLLVAVNPFGTNLVDPRPTSTIPSISSALGSRDH